MNWDKNSIFKNISFRRFSFLLAVTLTGSFFLTLIYRYLYLQVIKAVYPGFSNLNFPVYIYYTAGNDVLVILIIFFIIFILYSIFCKFKRLPYIIMAIILLIVTITYYFSLSYFRIFEAPAKLTTVSAGLGGFWKAILFSALFEITPIYYVYLASVILVVSFAVVIIYLMSKNMEKLNIIKIWSFKVLVIALISLLYAWTPSKNERVFMGNYIQGVILKYSRFPIEDYAVNPFQVIEKYFTYNPRMKSHRRINSSKSDYKNFKFRLNTDSLVTNRAHPRLPVKRGKQYNIIFYFFESTCQYYLGKTVNGKKVTPNWERLGKNSFVSPNHYVHSPLSVNSRITVLSSSYEPPSEVWVTNLYPRMKVKSIIEILSEKGYSTAVYHSGSLRNFANHRYLRHRKVDEMKDSRSLKNRKYRAIMSWAADDREMIDPAVKFIRRNSGKPFFITFMPAAPHHPYVVPHKKYEIVKPRGTKKERRWKRYINSIHYSDAVVGELVDRLENEGLMENTLFFLFADHGQAFFQHMGNYLHALFLYEENVHVPFLIYNKKLFPQRWLYSGISRNVDIVPTVLDMLRIPEEKEHEGISLLSDHPQKLAYFHTQWTKDYVGVRDGKWKYILRMNDKYEELYDVSKDRWEKKNLAGKFPEIASMFKKFVLNARKYKINYYRAVR
ncbi:LTA synthase family protein [Spirochaetota bacterium]